MATNDVPGANPANNDVLCAGCWAEHQDGSLIYVKGTENGSVVFEIFDMAQEPPVYYQDAMREGAFKEAFTWKPGNPAGEKWTWHDKTTFPWQKVMKTFGRPVPRHADVYDQLSAAARVAQSLRLRGQRLTEAEASGRVEQEVPKKSAAAGGIVDRVQRAIKVLLEG